MGMNLVALESAVKDRWDALVRVSTVWGNVDTENVGPDAVWARASVDMLERRPSVLIGDGKGRPRNQMQLTADFYGRSGNGEGPVLLVAQTVADAFDGKDLSATGYRCLRFGLAEVRRLGKTSQGYWQINVTVPFRADET